MSNKVCVIISECTACSDLSREEIGEIQSLLRTDPRIASVIAIKPLCSKIGRKELRNFSVEECDRAALATWCLPGSIDIARLLPKSISSALVDIVNLLLISPKNEMGENRVSIPVRAIRASVSKLSLAEPTKDRRRKFASSAIAVIGSGDRALRVARTLASLGAKTKLLLLEPRAENDKTENLEIIDGVTPERLSGYPGNFLISIMKKDQELDIAAAAILLVSERCSVDISSPSGSKLKFVPLEQFENYSAQMSKVKGIVFFDDLWAISSSTEHVIPAWHLLLESAKNAALANLADSVAVIARDIKSTGLLEFLWAEAADAGVQFVRYDDRSRPRLEKSESLVTVKDLVLGESLSLPADIIVAPTKSRPWEPLFIEKLFIPADWNLRARIKGPQRGTAQSTCDGIFLIGYADFNRPSDELEPELSSAIVQILSFVRQGYIIVRGAVAEVDEEKCSSCMTCVRTCPYRAARMNENWKAEILSEKCAGCGSCVAVCPSRAIELKNCTTPQIQAQLSTSLEEVMI